MIVCQRLYEHLRQKGISFYTGVPDSLLKYFLKYIQDHAAGDQHIITANEGLAAALASGYYLSAGKLPLVYLQNSGLGNMINPLTSLTDKEMYSIPMLLLIGWRGRPGIKDEPQHVKMGRITMKLLEAMEIPCYELQEDEEKSFSIIDTAIDNAIISQAPVALLAKEGLFEKYEGIAEQDEYKLQREAVIRSIIEKLKGNETVVCTTGKIGREFYEQNIHTGNKISRYFLCAGAMGHAGHIALGIQMQSGGKIIMLDGDGALLMHMGALPAIAKFAGDDFLHIVINNGSHESVGGQPTAGFEIDLCAVAKACGYDHTQLIRNETELTGWLARDAPEKGTCFIEIRTNRRSNDKLGRPAGMPQQWKETFMEALKKTE